MYKSVFGAIVVQIFLRLHVIGWIMVLFPPSLNSTNITHISKGDIWVSMKD